MKKLLFILFLFVICLNTIGQIKTTPSKVIRVPNNVTIFGESIPSSTIIIDNNTGVAYNSVLGIEYVSPFNQTITTALAASQIKYLSPWTSIGAGVTYGNSVGIGVTPSPVYKLNVLSDILYSPAAYIKNNNVNGHGVWIYGGSTASESALYVGNYDGSSSYLQIKGNGDMLMNSLKSDATPTDVLYYNPSTKEVSHGAKPAGGSGMTYPAAGIALSTGTAWGTSITNNSANWNTAYGWGNHASAGYLTSQISHADVVVDSNFASNGILKRTSAGVYGIVADNSANWNTAYANNGKVLVNGSSTPGVLSASNFSYDTGIIYPIISDVIQNGSFMPITSNAVYDEFVDKQDVLVSGTNLKTVNGRSLLGTGDINAIITKTANTSCSLDVMNETNISVSTNTAITITLTNIPSSTGQTGNIEVLYTGAAVITFDIPTKTTVYIASNIYNTTVDANTKTVLSKSSGPATYSYWIVGNNIYIHGTQDYN